jgi:hypothetical protein
VDGIYIDITRQKIVGLKMKLMTIVLQKRTLIYQLVFGFLYSDRVNYVIGIGMSIDHIGSVLWDGTFYRFFRKWYHCDCISYCVLKSKIFEHVNTSHIHDLAKLCLVLVFSGLIFFHNLC